VIHFGDHKHLVENGKCREFLNIIRRLTVEEVDHTPKANICAIFVNANKIFLAKYLFNDYSDGLSMVSNWNTSNMSFVNGASLMFVTSLLLSSIV
jgi:hypothetical protein